MFNHVVMWRFKDEADGRDKKANLAKAKSKLQALPHKISEIKYYTVALNELESDRSYDMMLFSSFDSKNDLDVYRVHPDHIEAAEFIRAVTSEAAVVDYQD